MRAAGGGAAPVRRGAARRGQRGGARGSGRRRGGGRDGARARPGRRCARPASAWSALQPDVAVCVRQGVGAYARGPQRPGLPRSPSARKGGGGAACGTSPRQPAGHAGTLECGGRGLDAACRRHSCCCCVDAQQAHTVQRAPAGATESRSTVAPACGAPVAGCDLVSCTSCCACAARRLARGAADAGGRRGRPRRTRRGARAGRRAGARAGPRGAAPGCCFMT